MVVNYLTMGPNNAATLRPTRRLPRTMPDEMLTMRRIIILTRTCNNKFDDDDDDVRPYPPNTGFRFVSVPRFRLHKKKI